LFLFNTANIARTINIDSASQALMNSPTAKLTSRNSGVCADGFYVFTASSAKKIVAEIILTKAQKLS